MAWNEPGGGNKDRDPWGGGDQGPPDLDEALRKLQQRVGGLFGGRGGSSGSGGSGGPGFGLSGPLLGAIAAVALVVWGLMGFYQVDQQERAVVLRFGAYHSTVQPGLHWNPPLIDEVIKVNTTRVRAQTFREIMLTEDENIVEVNLSVQYVINNPEFFVLKVRTPESTLEQATNSALRHVVGGSRMDPVLTEGRAQIAQDVRVRLQRYLDSYQTGIMVSAVNVDDAQPPSQVQAAFDDVIKAREDEERVKNEAQAYANGIIPEARGRAQRQLEEANAYKDRVVARASGETDRFLALLTEYEKAPAVTRERLYLDSIETVYGNTNKVLIDVKEGSNLLYLPLDKMAAGAAAAQQSSSRGLDAQDLRDIADQVTEQLRREAAAGARSSRGGR